MNRQLKGVLSGGKICKPEIFFPSVNAGKFQPLPELCRPKKVIDKIKSHDCQITAEALEFLMQSNHASTAIISRECMRVFQTMNAVILWATNVAISPAPFSSHLSSRHTPLLQSKYPKETNLHSILLRSYLLSKNHQQELPSAYLLS